MFVIMYTSYIFANMFLCIYVYFCYNCNLLQPTFDIYGELKIPYKI